MIRRDSGCTLFPYTTLFRSEVDRAERRPGRRAELADDDPAAGAGDSQQLAQTRVGVDDVAQPEGDRHRVERVVGERKAGDRKSTRLNSSHMSISYAVFCLKK